MAFTGFTTDKLVGLPPELFSEVIPQITLPSELKITLHVFYRMSRQRGSAPRRVSWDELAEDKTLRRGLRAISKLRPPDELLAEGLEAAVRRTTGARSTGTWSTLPPTACGPSESGWRGPRWSRITPRRRTGRR